MPDCSTLYAAAQVCNEEYNQMVEDHEDEESAKMIECYDLWNQYWQCYYA